MYKMGFSIKLYSHVDRA